jgi:uncharacterized repeat protein (TIGR03803 family)
MLTKLLPLSFAFLLCSFAAAVESETVLYPFTPSTGIGPYGSLVFDVTGNLYGVTSAGGANGNGAVFELSKNNNGGWTYTVLYSFGIFDDGADSVSPLVFDKAGNLYGTTGYGGSGCNCGTVFELTPKGGAWTEQVLYSFTSYNGDGEYPYAGVTFESAGHLYGTTYYGGANGIGAVFELIQSSSGWTERIVYSFSGTDGEYPYGGLVFYKGNLYGTTGQGGTKNAGVVYKLVPSKGKWKETVVHNFGIGKDGTLPIGVVTFDAQGRMSGTTYEGGAYNLGTVYQLTPTNSGWTESSRYSFKGGNNGANPFFGRLAFDKTGRIYGTTYQGGTSGLGTAFVLTHSKTGFSERILHSFTGDTDGSSPYAGMVLGRDGNLYGDTTAGGGDTFCSSGCGTIFGIVP